MNTKAILVSTLFTALLAGTSAYADGDDDPFFYENAFSTESVATDKVNFKAPEVMKKASPKKAKNKINFEAPAVISPDGAVLSGRR